MRAVRTTVGVMPRLREDLIGRLRARKARVGVIGLGYVGLPLAVEFAKAGFETVGVDLDDAKVRRIESGDPCDADVSRADVEAMTASGRFTATSDVAQLKGLDSVNICVPTPLRKTKNPDLSHVVSAVKAIAVVPTNASRNGSNAVPVTARLASVFFTTR